ncbi:MAG: hypothetical protein OXG44_07945 [Gammaproteobacteria bacterium]|nr:hypothetical protein [Gammaproteobacteria bacterium]MDE0191218.1 hypothetical protein [Gammaproteobacteria bacterium]
MRDVTAFSVGDIIRTSFAVYFSNLPAFLPLSLIVFLPAYAVVLLPDSSSLNDPPIIPVPSETQDPGALFDEFVPFYVVLMRETFMGWLCVFWLEAALAFGVVRHLRGGHAGFMESFIQFVRRIVPASVVAVIVAVVTSVGFMLFIVPGVVLTMILWVAAPAVVVERGGLRALSRSAELTRGFKGQIFGLALILGVFQFVAAIIAGTVSTAITTNSLLAWTMAQAVGLVLSGIWATAVAVTYHDLRVLREGVDTRTVSRVFE